MVLPVPKELGEMILLHPKHCALIWLLYLILYVLNLGEYVD